MLDWIGRYGGFALIAAGWLLLTGLIPSAAGPADALRGVRVALPAAAPPDGGTAAPRLIANPRRSPLGGTDTRAAAATPPAATPTAAPPVPTAEPAPEPVVAPEPEPLVEPAPDPGPPPAPTDRIVIPRIGVNTKVIDVGILGSGEMETASFAAGRLTFGAQAGELGNAVIAGHNDVEGEVFRRLPELRAGDEIILYRGEAAFRYRVEIRTMVREDGATDTQRYENARWMDPTDEATCTLISCYPYRVDTHRIIVRARLVEAP